MSFSPATTSIQTTRFQRQPLNRFWRSWLLQPGSLTAELKRVSGQLPEVCNLTISRQLVTNPIDLSITSGIVREVDLKIFGEVIIRATSYAAIGGGSDARAIRYLSQPQPIGPSLFRMGWKRKTLQAFFRPGAKGNLWHRKSVFTSGKRWLVVEEQFLPGFAALLARKQGKTNG